MYIKILTEKTNGDEKSKKKKKALETKVPGDGKSKKGASKTKVPDLAKTSKVLMEIEKPSDDYLQN
jgi:hypothetical protein